LFLKQGDLSPRARGFVPSSFIKGFRPDEFFFGAMTGRDSLMDTALRTPKVRIFISKISKCFTRFESRI